MMWGLRLAAWARQNRWALNLVIIALAAYFVAGAASSVVARSVRVVPSVDNMPPPAPPKPDRSSRSQTESFGSIAERNLLAAKREALTPTGMQAGGVMLVSGKDFKDSELQPCTLQASVRATIVADGAPEWSMAVLLDNRTQEPQVYSTNDGSNQIADDAALVDIRRGEVVVRRRDHFEICRAEGMEPGAGASPLAAITSQPPMPDEAGGGGGPGVTKVSETEYAVDRGEVDAALSNLNEVATQARIVPSFKDGKANGFKLFSIKPGSIYSKIGLRNGDVIQKINGYEMNSPEKALELYQKLRDTSSVTIELERRGKVSQFTYNIGGGR